MLLELIGTFFHRGSGYLLPFLFGDVILVITTTYLVQNVIIPFIKARNRGKILDQMVGTDNKHWLYGHTKKYGFNESGLKNTAKRTARFPAVFNFWYTPMLSVVQFFHSDVAASLLSSGAPKNEPVYNIVKPWVGDGLLMAKGKKWLRNRRLITPAFHFSVLQPYTSIFNSCARIMLKKWEKTTDTSLEVSLPINLMTMDIILQCSMSSKTDCQHVRTNPHLDAVRTLEDCIVTRLTTPIYFIGWIFYRTETGKKFKEACDLVHAHTEKLITERRKILQEEQAKASKEESNQEDDDIAHFTRRGKKALDFLDILLQTKDEDGKGLTDAEIRDEVDTFLAEGHDTVASGISWAFYNLAKYPEFQEKCREEVISVVGDKEDVEWNDIPKLAYLTMFLKESMRLNPPVPAIGRRLHEPLTVRTQFQKMKEMIIPKNTGVGLSIFALHRNIHVWEKPDEFDPERFSKENQTKRSPHAYLPFSAGSRNCIGQNFAMNQVRVVVSQVLRKYRLYLDDETPKPQMQALLVLRSVNGIWLKLKRL